MCARDGWRLTFRSKPRETKRSGTEIKKHAHRARSLLIAMILIGLGRIASSGQTDTQALTPTVTTTDVIQKMVEQNEQRANCLRHYTARRHYHLEYRGFPRSADATMEVEAIYDAPSKSFRVLAESGSHKIVDHVFKKLLKAEQDAASEQRDNGLDSRKL